MPTGRDSIEHLPLYAARPAAAPLALEGTKVVDFTQFIAGPYCTVILADFGADVLKIENPSGGDDMRLMKGAEIEGGEGGPFLWANRNKRSVALDLTQPAGRDVALALIAQADVVVENFSTGVMQRFGLDYETVAKLNPSLVYCSISAAGRDGPLGQRVAFDPISQAETGFIALNTLPGNSPRAFYTPIADLTTGMMAASAVLAALAARARVGPGQLIEIAMFDQGINLLAYHGLNNLINGVEPVALTESAGPTGVFRTSDNDLYVCCANDRTFRRLMVGVLGREDLAEDPRFATMRDRAKNSREFLAIISELLLTDTQANWLARMRDRGVPVAPVASVSEALRGPEVAQRGLVSRIPHPVAGFAPHMASPFRMSVTPIADPIAAPSLGQHTLEVLSGVLGYDEETYKQLEDAGAFGARKDTTD